MTTFTPDEIKQAQESPRAGDVWRKNDYEIRVEGIRVRFVQAWDDGDEALGLQCFDDFAAMTARAALVKRGDA